MGSGLVVAVCPVCGGGGDCPLCHGDGEAARTSQGGWRALTAHEKTIDGIELHQPEEVER